METQAFFENIQAQIQTRLLAAEHDIDLAVAWFTDRVLFDVVCKKVFTEGYYFSLNALFLHLKR